MAPRRSPLRLAGVAAFVALALGGAEASMTVNNVLSASASASASASVKKHRASSAAAATASSRTLARGSMARNVQAAQYVLAANQGFFSWWPSFGWRSFLGWWASWSKSASAVSASGNHTGDLDKLVVVEMGKPAGVDAASEPTAPAANTAADPGHLVVVEMGKPAPDASGVLRNFVTRGQEDAEAGTISGLTESLDEYGYQRVARSRSEGAMVQFMKRTMAKERLRVVDEETMYDVVKFYDGECATQTYRNLVEELHRAEHHYLCHVAWATRDGGHASTHGSSIPPLVLLGKPAPSDQPEAEGLSRVGSVAALNEDGYQAVANARNTSETMVFIQRVLDSLHLKVTDHSGLQHFAPYYSGECARQSFTRLLKELRKAPTRPPSCGGGWVGDA